MGGRTKGGKKRAKRSLAEPMQRLLDFGYGSVEAWTRRDSLHALLVPPAAHPPTPATVAVGVAAAAAAAMECPATVPATVPATAPATAPTSAGGIAPPSPAIPAPPPYLAICVAMTPAQRALHSQLWQGVVRLYLYTTHDLPAAVRLALKEATGGDPELEMVGVSPAGCNRVTDWAVSRMARGTAARGKVDSKAERDELLRLSRLLVDPDAQVMAPGEIFMDDAERRAKGPNGLTAAKAAVRAFGMQAVLLIDGAATRTSLLRQGSNAYKDWVLQAQRSRAFWRAFQAMFVQLGGYRGPGLPLPRPDLSLAEAEAAAAADNAFTVGEQAAVLRRLQGLFVDRFLHALVDKILARLGATRKGDEAPTLALRTALKGRALASTKRKKSSGTGAEGDSSGGEAEGEPALDRRKRKKKGAAAAAAPALELPPPPGMAAAAAAVASGGTGAPDALGTAAPRNRPRGASSRGRASSAQEAPAGLRQLHRPAGAAAWLQGLGGGGRCMLFLRGMLHGPCCGRRRGVRAAWSCGSEEAGQAQGVESSKIDREMGCMQGRGCTLLPP